MPKSNEWFHKFFGGLYGRVLAGAFSPAASARQARLVKKLLRLRKGQSVLDCPCGQGRLTIPLAQMGLAMTGVDVTEGFLRRAQAEARRKRVKIEFARRDMRKLDYVEKFDALVNWFTSFGYFSDSDNLDFLRRARRALKPGGQILIEVLNKSWVLPHFHTGHDETINGIRIVSRCRWDARSSRTINTWTLSQGRRHETNGFSLRIYTGPEMKMLLRQAGFRDIRLLGHSAQGVGKLNRHCKRFIVIGRR